MMMVRVFDAGWTELRLLGNSTKMELFRLTGRENECDTTNPALKLGVFKTR
jgi:hypothetical protein